jgi:Holliday junction DNA helicase RuvA
VIASVNGVVQHRDNDHVVVECAGVGYRLSVSGNTLKHVPINGEPVMLLTHLTARDETMQLYGFASEQERQLFLMLQGVGGVGPRVALAILSTGSPAEVAEAIAGGDAARLAVPGIGRRTSERIVIELRERMPAVSRALEERHRELMPRRTTGAAVPGL